MTKEEFEQLVDEGIGEIPEKMRKKMENVEIVIEEEPSPAQLQELKLSEKCSLFGLYQGVPHTKRGGFYANVLPDKITLFRKVIESHCRTPEAIKERVKRTVWHEIAHHFGFNEKEVREMERKRFRD
jgi:predicted Zn-dependent protease with MMP-like domain